ncbi:MAG: hypothetical protein PWQ57_2759 [Desulfovibrionales bacterium]|nr:hypothetical protein [Desulfovibrionales bacterium]
MARLQTAKSAAVGAFLQERAASLAGATRFTDGCGPYRVSRWMSAHRIRFFPVQSVYTMDTVMQLLPVAMEM